MNTNFHEGKIMNGHDKGRNYKLYGISERLILTVLDRWRHHDYVSLPAPLNLPEGAEIHGVDHSAAYGGVTLAVWHPSFPEVPPGVYLPVAEEPFLSEPVTLMITRQNGQFIEVTPSRDWFADVLAFHRKFGCAIGATPGVLPDRATFELRDRLHAEESDELRAAMINGDLPGIADGVVDLIYVLLGTLVSYGIDPRPVWREVHQANMAKEGGATRADGKILKPDGWVAPDVAGILRKQPSIVRDERQTEAVA
jgi:predicted HAD superfamily Cof-like phosphohydrolase